MIDDMRIKKVLYGGDYNPEQWPEEIWAEDMRLFRLAEIDIVTLNVFSWAALQPDENTYCFDRLDRIMELVRKNGLKVCMATSTAAHPAWMAKRHPDVLRTEFNGMRRKFGSRHNSCPNSPSYRYYAPMLARKLAERYQGYDNIVAWHVCNEYGGGCYCENCEAAFRVWLREKYHTLDELNRSWDTAFWGHTFYDWDEIVAPNLLSEHFEEDRTNFQGISLDYKRFQSDSMMKNYEDEAAAIHSVIPGAKITTNLMGLYKHLDYQKWAKVMDFISWDNYPANEDPYAKMAMNHDLMRGIKGGKPFVLMEQTPSVTNWLSYNALKRPGVMRLWSYQAMAHGADAVMFFQLRRSIGACEKYHGAVIDHAGHEHTRVFREVQELGRELGRLGEATLGARGNAQVAILFAWDNWWATEYSAGPSRDLGYPDEIFLYYRALTEQNYSVDLIGMEDELGKYRMVIAPLLYMLKENFDERIREYVAGGGVFLTTYFSGFVDEHDLVVTGGYPGKLKELLGIWVEESDALPAGKANSFVYEGASYPAELICDIIHLRGAKALAEYEEDFYAGMPVVTENSYGKGKAYYVGTRSSLEFFKLFLKHLLKMAGVNEILQTLSGVEVTERIKGEKSYWFVMNHSEESKRVFLPEKRRDLITGHICEAGEEIKLRSKDVMILEGKSK